MPLFMTDCIFIDRDIEFITYGINHKSLRPTPNILSSLLLLRRGISIVGVPRWGNRTRGACHTAKGDELLFELRRTLPTTLFCMKYPVVSFQLRKLNPDWFLSCPLIRLFKSFHNFFFLASICKIGTLTNRCGGGWGGGQQKYSYLVNDGSECRR